MRKVAFGGAMSLDGFIAGPNGEYDWILMDPEIDFVALMARFDTFLIGRKTYEMMKGMGSAAPATKGVTSIVCSTTLQPADCPKATLTRDAAKTVAELRTQEGKDIAIFGGGDLFRSLLAAGEVDEVSVAVVPVLLGGGVPLLPPPAGRATLTLRKHRVYAKTGTVALDYEVRRAQAPARTTRGTSARR